MIHTIQTIVGLPPYFATTVLSGFRAAVASRPMLFIFYCSLEEMAFVGGAAWGNLLCCSESKLGPDGGVVGRLRGCTDHLGEMGELAAEVVLAKEPVALDPNFREALAKWI